MSKSDTKIQVKVNIRTGPMTPHQCTAWQRFWQKLIAEVKAGER